MKNSFLIISVFVGLVASILLIRSLINNYNSLQQADESINARWSSVVNQYQRRADLVPNLVRIVKAYAKHETGLFKEITQAHNSILKEKQSLEKYQLAQDHMSGLLSKLIFIAKDYPELHSNESFLGLQAQLEGTENRISYARDKYIQAVSYYNKLVRSVPTSWIADYLEYKVKPNFSLGESYSKSSKPPVVGL